ncbi:hypothetical protein [Pseudomonas sp. FP2294]|uniref:hypothetical protein n=1 Tax=Pseudomonas sp. FP2294 TaxID=2954089 RepID=UPI0027373F8E|nr:hypothetical protein [Pseudomonas sp. FP2294]WLH55614.1 hypothetical protein PSH73_16980 [Pseudomonas sp. FP2294]
MAATKFLDDLLDGFVCVADLITSVSYSDEDSILTLQDAARAVLACLRSVKKAPQQMRLDKAGLPVIDLDGGATIFLRKVAENKRYSSLQVSDVVLDEALTSEGADLLEYGFSRDIWDVLREDGIQTSWRLNYKTGLRKYSFLSSVWKATPREISVLLEGQGYKRPTVVSLIRKGYAVPAISLSGVAERTAELEIDQEVDLGDVRRWLSKNGINWPIPVMVECEPSEYSYELQTRSSNDTSRAFTVRLQELERQNTDLLQQNADLKAQLLNVKSSSVDQGASPQGLNFPYATKELEAMRQIALKYWAQYSPEMRQPKQDEIQREFCSLLGLNVPAEKTPPHKAIYLATAIKPDHLIKP